MDAQAVLDRLAELGVTASAEGGKVWIEPASKVPAELKAALRENKPEILTILTGPTGNGQAPPLDRPPRTEEELRRLIDHLADPVAFTRWLEWAMNQTDSAEEID